MRDYFSHLPFSNFEKKLHQHQNRIFQYLQKLRAIKPFEVGLFQFLVKKEQKQNTFSGKDNLRLRRQ